MELFQSNKNGLTDAEIKEAIIKSIEGKELKKVLLIPPDITRFYSKAGYITNVYYNDKRRMFRNVWGYSL